MFLFGCWRLGVEIFHFFENLEFSTPLYKSRAVLCPFALIHSRTSIITALTVTLMLAPTVPVVNKYIKIIFVFIFSKMVLKKLTKVSFYRMLNDGGTE